MEDFEIKERLGKGAQATAFVVESKTDGKKYVLKKVECFDESEANKAFSEALNLQLQKLPHPYVSGYNQFFVLWEKEESSVHICIVMDYFPKGTLANAISKCQEKKEVIDEERIMKWLGQMLEALIFVHKKNIIHRDVRPSNVYIQEDDTLCLGDFSVATIMGDTITCTRASAGSLYYMAPEVRHIYLEKSDIWSLGCVLFELVTTWLYEGDQAVAKLQEIKEDQMILEEVFEDIEKHYSGELIKVLRMMLRTDHMKRASTQSLLSQPFIKKCIDLSDSTQLEKRKRIQSASSSTQSETMPVPKNKGVREVLEYLAQRVDFESCVKGALEYLVELSQLDEGLTLDPVGKKLIAMAMKNNMRDEAIQVAGCTLLNHLLMSAEDDDVLYLPEIISVVPYAMEHHIETGDVQLTAATLLTALAANSTAAEALGYMGAIHDVLEALRSHSNNPQTCASCLNALWALTTCGTNVKIATEEKGVSDVCSVLRTHMVHADVSEAACASLLALSLDEENLEQIGSLNAVGLLINAIQMHMKNSKVVKNACLALASLVEIDEESAYRVLTNEGPDGAPDVVGLPIVMSTYEVHKDNADVVESIVTLFMELSEYDDICRDLHSYKVFGQIEEAKKKFASNKDIMGPCEKAIERLQGQTNVKGSKN